LGDNSSTGNDVEGERKKPWKMNKEKSMKKKLLLLVVLTLCFTGMAHAEVIRGKVTRLFGDEGTGEYIDIQTDRGLYMIDVGKNPDIRYQLQLN
jgi:hypothetical protein